LFIADRIRGTLADQSKLLGLALSADERSSLIPYAKTIVLEEGPLLLEGETVDAEFEGE
jgi:hypothetical protein